MNQYKHTQPGYFLLIAYSAVILILAFIFIITKFNPLVLIMLVIMLFVLVLFASMTVAVDDQMIKIKYGLGVISKRFLLKEIDSFRVVKNPWYYGWGIRYTPRGWLFRVSGHSAIELQMKSGKLYRIGTDEPGRLAKVLSEYLNGSPIQ